MAMLQRSLVEHVLPSLFVDQRFDATSYIVRETSDESLLVCSAQRIKSSQYSAFNVLGLVIVGLVGLIILICNYVIVNITMRCRRRKGRGFYKHEEWMEHQILQLQRMVFQYQGFGPWKGQTDTEPTTTTFGQVFSPPKVSRGHDRADDLIDESFPESSHGGKCADSGRSGQPSLVSGTGPPM